MRGFFNEFQTYGAKRHKFKKRINPERLSKAKEPKGLFFYLTCRFIAFLLSFSLIFSPVAGYAQAVNLLNLPAPGTMVGLSPVFNPAVITGLKLYPDNPLQFDFIIDTGDDALQGDALKAESQKLINYFMATLTVPENEMWVNLSPYEKDRIIADGLSRTEMGRDMLAQDYLLKQLSASLMYPEDELGNEFWTRIRKKAQEQFGTAEIPMNTFNKIWIVPDEATVYVHDTNVFIVKNHLKVMLEEDYLAMASQQDATAKSRAPARGLALESNRGSTKHGLGNVTKDDLDVISGVSSDIVREILLPEIEKEVNRGKNFANLRQMYNSMLLATWYKKNLKESVITKIYANRNKTDGIEISDKQIKQKIYDRYVEAFEKGVYNYIREDVDAVSKQVIPRKYFSGGMASYAKNGLKTTGYMSSPIVEDLEDQTYVAVRMKGRTETGGSSSPVSREKLKELAKGSPQAFKVLVEAVKKGKYLIVTREYFNRLHPDPSEDSGQERSLISSEENISTLQDEGFIDEDYSLKASGENLVWEHLILEKIRSDRELINNPFEVEEILTALEPNFNRQSDEYRIPFRRRIEGVLSRSSFFRSKTAAQYQYEPFHSSSDQQDLNEFAENSPEAFAVLVEAVQQEGKHLIVTQEHFDQHNPEPNEDSGQTAYLISDEKNVSRLEKEGFINEDHYIDPSVETLVWEHLILKKTESDPDLTNKPFEIEKILTALEPKFYQLRDGYRIHLWEKVEGTLSGSGFFERQMVTRYQYAASSPVSFPQTLDPDTDAFIEKSLEGNKLKVITDKNKKSFPFTFETFDDFEFAVIKGYFSDKFKYFKEDLRFFPPTMRSLEKLFKSSKKRFHALINKVLSHPEEKFLFSDDQEPKNI